MSYARSQRAPSSSAPQQTTGATGPQQGGAGNAAAQDAMNGGGKGRKTNLAFGFKESELRSLNLEPAALKNQVLDLLDQKRRRESKDGADLTDTEKLFVVAKLLWDQGYKANALSDKIQGMFFDRGGNSAADKVAGVHVSAGEVRVEFTTSSGFHTVAGSILPLIATPPAAYAGLDTNDRGARVRALQERGAFDKTPRTGTFLKTRPGVVENLFKLEDWYQVNGATHGPGTPKYRVAYHDFETQLLADYMDKGIYYVKQQLGPVDGRSADELLQAALDAAMKWTNPNLGAVAHTEIELQDEAIAQAVLEDLGFSGANVDTDAEAKRIAAKTP